MSVKSKKGYCAHLIPKNLINLCWIINRFRCFLIHFERYEIQSIPFCFLGHVCEMKITEKRPSLYLRKFFTIFVKPSSRCSLQMKFAMKQAQNIWILGNRRELGIVLKDSTNPFLTSKFLLLVIRYHKNQHCLEVSILLVSCSCQKLPHFERNPFCIQYNR